MGLIPMELKRSFNCSSVMMVIIGFSHHLDRTTVTRVPKRRISLRSLSDTRDNTLRFTAGEKSAVLRIHSSPVKGIILRLSLVI